MFNSTLVIVNYDENDGQFDHVPPPVPPQGEFDEFVDSGTLAAYGVTVPLPVGFGFRVPLILISPWTRGGWVTSEVSDHTSVLQFLEKWTQAMGKPAICPNISAWRRQVAGDLVNAFDFGSPVYGLPHLPDPGALIPEVEYTPLPDNNAMPAQEPGSKLARPLPFQPNANLVEFNTDASGELVAVLEFSNVASFVTKASHFAVYNNLADVPSLAAYPGAFPGQYTVAAWENAPRHGRGRRSRRRHRLRHHRGRSEPLSPPLHRQRRECRSRCHRRGDVSRRCPTRPRPRARRSAEAQALAAQQRE